MSTWMLSRITDYWDSRADAIFTLAQRLEVIERENREPLLSEIASCVERHLDRLSTEQLTNCAWIMVDDIYRASTALSYWDESIHDYLSASSRPLLGRLGRLGYTLRYFVDNEFQNTPVGLALPAEWLPRMFGATGLSYICPQAVAYRQINSDGRRSDAWTDMLPAYLPEARRSALDALERCRALGSNLVFLDAESHVDALDRAFDSMTPGVIAVLRSEPPHLSSRCMVKIVPPVT